MAAQSSSHLDLPLMARNHEMVVLYSHKHFYYKYQKIKINTSQPFPKSNLLKFIFYLLLFFNFDPLSRLSRQVWFPWINHLTEQIIIHTISAKFNADIVFLSYFFVLNDRSLKFFFLFLFFLCFSLSSCICFLDS